MRKILISSPVIGSFPAAYMKALVELLTAPRTQGITLGFMYCQTGGINWARDQMADYALKYGFDELIMWDIDLKPNLAMFHRLISHAEPDIVCGFYAKKDPKTHFNVQRIAGNVPDPKTGLEVVSRCAIGFSKIKTHVFRKIISDTPERAYTLMNEGESAPTAYHQLFPFEIVDGNYLGEDYGFIRLAQVSGFPVHVDTQLLIPHAGAIDFPLELQEPLAEPVSDPADAPKTAFSVLRDGEPLWPADYIRPGLSADHCRDVLEGCYDIAFDPAEPPTILDIGANIGAFARWAFQRWPGATIHCYEPNPSNFGLLRGTVQSIQNCHNVPSIYQQAVSDKSGYIDLYPCGFNCGEHTTVLRDDLKLGKTSISVQCLDAVELPSADILKIDAEGAEPLILQRLADTNRLSAFKAIVLEFHADSHRIAITDLLKSHGFTLYSQAIHSTHRGILKFLKL